MLAVSLPKVQGQVILDGDSNIPLDRILDKSILKRVPKNSSKVALLLNFYDFIDAWCEAYPSTRDYTHFSQVHHIYCQIDHIFVHTSILSFITSVKILSVHPLVRSFSDKVIFDCFLD